MMKCIRFYQMKVETYISLNFFSSLNRKYSEAVYHTLVSCSILIIETENDTDSDIEMFSLDADLPSQMRHFRFLFGALI